MRTSAELNDLLRKIEGDESIAYSSPMEGKRVPYIGWFWRSVDFDSPGPYTFGVIPAGTADLVIDGKPTGPRSGCNKVGFMENNKWGYPEIEASPDQWVQIKALANAVCDNPCRDTLFALDSAIQALAAGRNWKVVVEHYEFGDLETWEEVKDGS